jgi:MFS family permease
MQDDKVVQPSKPPIFAAIIGNAFEFYDFTIYAIFSIAIGQAFFPSHDPTVSLLLSVGTFGLGFLARPVGGLLIGIYADTAGRRPAMILTIAMMAVGTLIIALTPSFVVAGIAAPLLIAFARLLQGAALGGELGAATAFLVEIAPSGRRSLYASWQIAGQGAAIAIASALGLGLTQMIGAANMAAWGWRIPFALGFAILPVGLYMRRQMPETVSRGRSQRGRNSYANGLQAFRRLSHTNLPVMLAVAAQILFGTVAAYIGNYLATYTLFTLQLPLSFGLAATASAGACTFAGALCGGWLGDRFGHRLATTVPRIVLMLAAYPAFRLVIDRPSLANLLIMSGGLAILAMLSVGSVFGSIAGALPPKSRAAELSVIYAVVIALFGGTTQILVAWLISVSGDAAIPAYYLILVSVISLPALYWLPNRGAPDHHDEERSSQPPTT